MKIAEAEKRIRAHILNRFGPNINCFHYHLELVKHIGHGEPYYNGDHVLTLLRDGKFYDFKGVAFYPMKEEPNLYNAAHNWPKVNRMKLTDEQRLDRIEKRIGIVNE
jgi:hypothetical protein